MSKSIDWERVDVVAALDDYRGHRTLKSLAQLQERLHQVTGVRVTYSFCFINARARSSQQLEMWPRFKSEGSSGKAKDMSMLLKQDGNLMIMGVYFELMRARSLKAGYPSVFVFSSHFYTALIGGSSSARSGRWTSSCCNIFNFDLLFIPVYTPMHWTVVIVDLRRKQVTHYDSNGGRNGDAVNALLTYLREEGIRKNVQLGDVTVRYVTEPHQENGIDCGFFVMQYAECMSRDPPPLFSQANIPDMRRKMIVELLQLRLLS